MRTRDALLMLLLGALWGGAFPLLRVASPLFGAIPLSAIRVGVASAVLLVLAKDRALLRRRPLALLGLGIVNTAVPFSLFAFATQSVTSGLAALLNATTPMFGALVAYLWLGEKLSRSRILGIVISFAGIAWLVWGGVGVHGERPLLGIAAGLAGAALYGFAASYARRYLSDGDATTIAAGGVIGASLVLAAPAAMLWPATPPPMHAWLAAIALGLLCTALAYRIYFHLLRTVGAGRSVAVTFLFPAFGMLWGALFLGESITARLLTGCAIVLAGTALAVGLADRRRG